MRGEYMALQHWMQPTTGSPLLARGSTHPTRESWRPSEDHPRLRGEYYLRGDLEEYPPGSPPLTRGVRVSDWNLHKPVGITPACTGSTVTVMQDTEQEQDHPRLHGEYWGIKLITAVIGGSPPLARGVHIRYRNRRANGGITPACAGSTSGLFRLRSAS